MLTFITYFLLKNPDMYRKLREEIDTKIGDRSMTAQDVGKLPYLLGGRKRSSFETTAHQTQIFRENSPKIAKIIYFYSPTIL